MAYRLVGVVDGKHGGVPLIVEHAKIARWPVGRCVECLPHLPVLLIGLVRRVPLAIPVLPLGRRQERSVTGSPIRVGRSQPIEFGLGGLLQFTQVPFVEDVTVLERHTVVVADEGILLEPPSSAPGSAAPTRRRMLADPPAGAWTGCLGSQDHSCGGCLGWVPRRSPSRWPAPIRDQPGSLSENAGQPRLQRLARPFCRDHLDHVGLQRGTGHHLIADGIDLEASTGGIGPKLCQIRLDRFDLVGGLARCQRHGQCLVHARQGPYEFGRSTSGQPPTRRHPRPECR